ncbi:hydroxymethylbilane synthase [Thermodesulfobacteriota bacterium]
MLLRIGTRGSKLALAQSNWVKRKVEAEHSRVEVELVKIKTRGDQILDSPLSKIGGKGLFVKEIEDELLDKRVDVAVHSMKDVPTEIPDGLEFAVFPQRENPRDAFVSLKYSAFAKLPKNALIGTSSLRRSAQLLHQRSDLQVIPLRGNVDTRLRKLESGEYMAIILAVAGLKRLGLEKRITEVIDEDQVIPAVGQGALGLEIRREDAETCEVLGFLNHPETELRIKTERAFLKELEGGCQVPLAAFCRLKENRLHLEGMVAEVDGSKILRDKITGAKEQAEEIGIELAKRLLDLGAGEILARIYGK